MTGALPLALGVASVGGTVAYLAVFVALHRLPTGYNPVHHAVSDYAVGPYGRWFAVGLWSSAIGVLTLAAGLAAEVSAPTVARGDLVLLALIAVARVGMSVFPTNVEDTPFTRSALLHYAFAIAAFTFTYLAISHLTVSLKAVSPWHAARGPLAALAWLVAPTLAGVVITMIGPLRRFFGLFERIFLLTTNAWFLTVAVLLTVRAA
jgi:uncharacterized protein DUF998